MEFFFNVQQSVVPFNESMVHLILPCWKGCVDRFKIEDGLVGYRPMAVVDALAFSFVVKRLLASKKISTFPFTASYVEIALKLSQPSLRRTPLELALYSFLLRDVRLIESQLIGVKKGRHQLQVYVLAGCPSCGDSDKRLNKERREPTLGVHFRKLIDHFQCCPLREHSL